MAKKFTYGKRYVFIYKRLKSTSKGICNRDIIPENMQEYKKFNGQEVEVTSEGTAYIGGLQVHPWWCKCIGDKIFNEIDYSHNKDRTVEVFYKVKSNRLEVLGYRILS